MTILELVPYGHPSLCEPARDVRPEEFSDPHFQRHVDDAIETLHSLPRACGLAAKQIGIDLNFFVIEDTPKNLEGIPEETLAANGRRPVELTICVNPKLIPRDPRTAKLFEGCFSHNPKVLALLERFLNIRLEAWDRNGEWFSIDASGFLARIIQHEFDHGRGLCISTQAIPGSFIPLDVFDREWRGKTAAEIAAKFELGLYDENGVRLAPTLRTGLDPNGAPPDAED